MSIKKINLIVEGRFTKEKKETMNPKKKSFELFINNTNDEFPYIEAAISTMDSNLKWWKTNWMKIQEHMEDLFYIEMKKTFEKINQDNKIRTHFTIYSGTDPKVKDVQYTGPAIEYIFRGANSQVVKGIQLGLEESKVIKGKKTFIENNKLIIMF